MKHPDPEIEAALARLASPALGVIDLSLVRIRKLMEALGNPQMRLPPVLHIAGTNGKGSLGAYLTAILQAAGYKVHRYISPHLMRFNERIMLAGKDITDAQLLPLLDRVESATSNQPVTFFEATTALAYLAFAETPADIVLLETGLGGRLDATNILDAPALTAITPISMDHTEYLGSTLALIAAEKAAIMKRGVPCVTGPQPPEADAVFRQAAARQDTELYACGRDWQVGAESGGLHYRSTLQDHRFPLPNLAGAHQFYNAGTAIACLERLEGFTVSGAQIAHGITHAQWPARLQHLEKGKLAQLLPPQAELWLDGGHNPGAGEILSQWMTTKAKSMHVICGMLKHKDTRAFLSPMAPYLASLTATTIPDEPLSQTLQELQVSALASGISSQNIYLTEEVRIAIEHIVSRERNAEPVILICGSLYLAGNILWQNSMQPGNFKA